MKIITEQEVVKYIQKTKISISNIKESDRNKLLKYIGYTQGNADYIRFEYLGKKWLCTQVTYMCMI